MAPSQLGAASWLMLLPFSALLPDGSDGAGDGSSMHVAINSLCTLQASAQVYRGFLWHVAGLIL